MTGTAPHRWGPFELDPATRTLRRDGVEVAVQPRTFDVLAALAARLDQAVSREELLAAAWPGTKVVDNALHQVIRRARAALGDDADEPRWLVSVARHGYRLRGAEPRPTLVAPRDAWVGREGELAALLAAGPGLTSVVGAGGLGKTRLVAEVAGRRPARWVDLAGAGDGALIPALVAAALGVSDVGAVEAALRRLDAALVLDNAEHLAAPLRTHLAAWLAAAPGLCVLVTSRVPLELPAERVLRLEPLPAPEAGALLEARAGRAFGADPLAAELLRQLDGLPLAIELFAGHARWLPLPDLLARLSGRLSATSDGRPDRPTRHETLRACLEVSWSLLPGSAHDVLRGLAWFESTFDAAGADALGGAEGEGAWRLPALGDHGFVRREPGRARWRVPAAAREWLRTLPDPAGAAHALAHAAWAARPSATHGDATPAELLAELLAAAARLPDDVAPELASAVGTGLYALHRRVAAREAIGGWLGRLAPRAGGDRLRLRNLQVAVLRHGPTTDVRVDEASDEVLSDAGAEPAVRAEGLTLRGTWRWRRGQAREAVADLESARELALAAGAPLALTLTHLSRVYRGSGRIEDAVRVAREALARARESEPAMEASALEQLGSVVRVAGDHGEARALLEAAIERHRARGDRMALAASVGLLGIVFFETGRAGEAAVAFEDALALYDELGAPSSACATRLNLGNALRELGDLDGAESAYRAVLEQARELKEPRNEAHGLLALGTTALGRAALDEGRAWIEQALALATSISFATVQQWAQVDLGRVSLLEGDAAAAELVLRAIPDGEALRDVVRDLLLARAVHPRDAAESARLLLSAEQRLSRGSFGGAELARDLAEARAAVRG
jgi:predicted ATPase